MSILIVSHASDIHASSTAWGLAIRGIHADFFCASDFLQRAFATFESATDKFSLAAPSANSSEYSIIWNRRLGAVNPGEHLHVADRAVAKNIGRDFLQAFYDCSDAATFVNSPTAAAQLERKVLQLKIAKMAGFSVPETIISNDLGRVREFVGRDFACIVKSLRPMVWKGGDTHVAMATTRINRSDLWDPISIQSCPMIYQRELSKQVEYRIVVFGSEIVCIEIDSQAVDGAELDWRDVGDHMLKMRAVECPDEMQVCILKFMSIAGILHGSFDLVRGVDGQIYFLEVNQQGQFLWLEQHLPEVHLLDRMVEFLAGGAKSDFKYCPPVIAATFEDYLSTGRFGSDEAILLERHIPEVDSFVIDESREP